MRFDNQKSFMRSLVIFIPLLLINCSDKPTQPGKTPISLQITAPAFSIYSGGTLQFSAIAGFTDGTISEVTTEAIWSISPEYAGSINEAGLFIAMMDLIGIVTVRADYQGVTDTARIEITQRARSLMILPVTTSIQSGRGIQFEAIADFFDASQVCVTKNVEWSVNPGVVATIDSNGLFHSIAGLNGAETVIGKYQALSAQSHVQVQETIENTFEMITIPAGSFIMGDNNGLPNEKPAHEVYIDAFEISKYEITNEQYAEYLNQALAVGEVIFESGIVTGRKGPFAWLVYCRLVGVPDFPDVFIEYVEVEHGIFEFQAKPGFEKFPIVRLNWYGAAAFCAFYGFRLPTEAEWEKASRGDQQLEYGTLDGSISHDLANNAGIGGNDIYDGLAPVGCFAPNPYGLYDMSGNAAEYVFDVYDENYYANSPAQNPIGPGPAMPIGRLPGKLALWRGGSWITSSKFCRSAFRGIYPDQADFNYLGQSFVGFRVARSLP